MIKYEVGKPFPFGLAKGIEECKASVNEAFFDIIYHIVDPSPSIIHTWRKGPLSYGLYTEDHIPFVLIDFTPTMWNFDLTINIHKVGANEVDDWLNAEGNIINMYLVDAKTSILEAMRMISVLPSVSERIRDVLDAQLNEYTSHEEVDAKVAEIMNRMTTAQMMSRSKMIRL